MHTDRGLDVVSDVGNEIGSFLFDGFVWLLFRGTGQSVACAELTCLWLLEDAAYGANERARDGWEEGVASFVGGDDGD